MKFKFWHRAPLFRRGKDERGSIMVQAIFYIAVSIGMTGLAVDGARFLLLRNSLQDLADAAALAGAAQLDGLQDAQTRADIAAQAIADRNPLLRLSYNAGGSTTISTRYYSSLNPDTVALDPKFANYIEVTTASSETSSGLVSGAVKVLRNSTVANNVSIEKATAQGNYVANCQPTQSFVCNPWESAQASPGQASNFSSNVSAGQMIALVDGAGAAGNWGLIAAPQGFQGCQGGSCKNPHVFNEFWAASSFGTCVGGNSQGNTRPGNVAKFAQDGMNVRFDSPIDNSGDGAVSAPVVINGFNPGPRTNSPQCNRIDPTITGNQQNQGNGIPAEHQPFQQADTDPTAYQNSCNAGGSCPLPRDRTFTNPASGNDTPWNNFQLGNGPNLTDLQAYWANHHAGTLPAGVTTRYQIYQREVPVAQGGLGTATFTTASQAASQSGPTCNRSIPGDISRRVITVAVVDCHYWGIQGQKALPPSYSLAQFFMTEPAMTGGTGVAGGGTPSGGGILLGEYIGSIPVSTSAQTVLHKIVRLVR